MSRDALVVGISTYQYLPALNAPAQDAEAIASQLETYGDFRVARLPEIVQSDRLRVGVKTPVTLMELEAALVKLFKPKGSNIPHTALFYYSGHGLQKEAGIHEGYLATTDANPAANFFGLSLFWLRRLLQESPVRQRIVLLDCCHSGEILNFLEADPGARSGTDRLFMAASREYESAYESLTGHYSVFTQALLEGLDPRRMPNGTVTNYALTDWVSTALKGESQQPLFENSGSEIILTQCQGPLTVINSSILEEVCPYRGLEPFDETHADYFFGRETLTDQLLDKLKSSQFLAVVGASGSGKSSLVRAGLVHKLQRGQTVSGSNHWQIRIITPTDYPFKSLANAFVNPAASPVDRAEQLHRAELLLQEGSSGFSQLIRASLMSEANKQSRLVLIIDQFEEVFTLCQGPHAEQERHRFFNCLLAGLREVGDRFSVVIVLRADFFSKCSFYRALSEQMEANLVMVTPLTYEQIKASILKPAEKVGLVCEPNLVYNILLDIVGAPGELPLLQYTLLELWHRRQRDPNGGSSRLTLDAYTELGGVRGTLQKRADELFYSLSLEEQQIAKRIFIALTQLGEGTEDTRRRVLKSELVSPQFSADLVEQVLEKLIRAKLVITNQMAPANGHQERIDQRLTNMSTALRLAQVARRKSPALPTTPSQQLALPAKQPLLDRGYNVNIARISHDANLEQFQAVPGMGKSCQETVDIAHEALIRNWSLLRSWLDENREMLRRQRQIERSAREWNAANQPHSPEYLLHGNRLLDAEDYLNHYPNELSALAQRFISVSQEESRRTRREVRLLQFTIPSALFFALGITFFQYQVALHNQAEKDYQLRVSTSRQWSAIAQSILQEPDGDPNTALLISRLAAEQGHTYEAEASLRAALQKLRLQATFHAGEKPISRLALSPDRNWLATLEQGNTIRLWSLAAQKVERVLQWHEGEEQRNDQGSEQAGDGAGRQQEGGRRDVFPGSMVAFSTDGKALVAVAQRANQIKIWSVESGKLQFQLGGFQAPITQVALSPDGKWIAAASEDRTIQVWQMQTGQLQSQFSQPIAPSSLTFSPDSKLLLAVSGNRTTLWQVDTRQSSRTLTAASPIQQTAFSADGRWIAMLCQDGKLQVQEVTTGQVRQTLAIAPAGQGGMVTAAAQLVFSPNSQMLAVNTGKDQLWVWNLESGQQWHIEPPPDKIQISNPGDWGAIAFSPDSHYLVTSQQRQVENQVIYVATLYDSQTGQEIGTLRGHTAPITAIQFTQDGSLIATSSLDSTVRLWSAEVGGELPSLKIADWPIQWLAFQQQNSAANKPADRTQSKPALHGIVTVATNGALQRWDLVHPLTISAAIKNSIGDARLAKTFSPISVRNNIVRTVNQISQGVGNLGTELQMHFSHLLKIGAPTSSQIQNSQSLIQAKGNYLYNSGAIAATTKQSQVLSNLTNKLSPQSKLASVAFSADGQRLATSDSTGKVAVWQINSDQTLHRIGELQAVQMVTQPDPAQPGQQGAGGNAIRYLAFSPDGQMLVGVGVDWTLRLWEVRSGKLWQSLTGHKAFVEEAQFSADGRRIISTSWDRTARIWEVESGQLKLTLSHKDGVTSAHFSPDGQQVVTTSLDGTAKIYDSYTGALQVILAGHRGGVLDAAFSPDGQTVATGSTDGIVRLWDASTGIEKAALRPARFSIQADAIKQITFSPDGHHLVALTSSGQLRLWIASWPGLLEVARDRSLRQLKPEECLRYLRLAPNVCPTLALNSNLRQ